MGSASRGRPRRFPRAEEEQRLPQRPARLVSELVERRSRLFGADLLAHRSVAINAAAISASPKIKAR
jgi:Mg2+/Co2+ transporter CorB